MKPGLELWPMGDAVVTDNLVFCATIPALLVYTLMITTLLRFGQHQFSLRIIKVMHIRTIV